MTDEYRMNLAILATIIIVAITITVALAVAYQLGLNDMIVLLMRPVDYGVVPRIQLLVFFFTLGLAAVLYYWVAEKWAPEEGEPSGGLSNDIQGENVNG